MKDNNIKCNDCSHYRNCSYCNNCSYCENCGGCNCCNHCYKCTYCNDCNNCCHCGKCNGCNYCNFCNGCNYCNYINFCKFCSDTNYCENCYSSVGLNFCKNISMTDYNYFCWAEKEGDKNSSMQEKYRVFNTQVSKEEYDKIEILSPKLELDAKVSIRTRFKTAFKKMWDDLSENEKQEYYNIPHFDKVGFEFITGVKIEK